MNLPWARTGSRKPLTFYSPTAWKIWRNNRRRFFYARRSMKSKPPQHRPFAAEQLILRHRYLKSATLVGERLCYVATYQGQWLALAAWSAPVWHLKARDAFIGWDDEQRRRPAR